MQIIEVTNFVVLFLVATNLKDVYNVHTLRKVLKHIEHCNLWTINATHICIVFWKVNEFKNPFLASHFY